MKKQVLIAAILAVFCGSSAFAADPAFAPVKGSSKTVYAKTSSGALLSNTLAPSSAYRRIVLDSVLGQSDLSTSVFTIQTSTDNSTYASVATLGCGATSKTLGMESEKPVLIGDPGLYLKVQLNSTTTGSMIVNYHEE